MIPAHIQPFPDEGPDRAYAGFLAAGEFKIQQCSGCQQHIFYPRFICPRCGARDLSWVIPSGDGVVYSTSIPRGAPEGDYNISLIDLAEGPRLMSRVVAIPPEDVAIGMRVRAHVGEIDGEAVVLFRRAEGE